MTRFGHKLNHVINTFVKRTPRCITELWKVRLKADFLGEIIGLIHVLEKIRGVIEKFVSFSDTEKSTNFK